MRLLERLVARPSETRYTLEDYSGWLTQAGFGSFGFNGTQYPLGLNLTQPGSRSQPIAENFQGFATHGLRGNGIIFSLEQVRVQVFAQARFQFRQLRKGRPGEMFGTPALAPLEGADGGPNGALLARTLLDADLAGNAFGCLVEGEIVRLRPDWVDVVLEPIDTTVGNVGDRVYGIVYWPGGERGRAAKPTMLMPGEYFHFAPMPDPLSPWRGMSWLTPVARELVGDDAYTRHKTTFINNAATPNLAVTLKESVTPAQFQEFIEKMNAAHQGPANAGKTLYLGGGADVTVVGADMKTLDFKAVQGATETRLAAASGVGAVIAQFSEGMQGSSLNAGNYAASRRRFADITMRHLWQEAASAFSAVIDVPRGAHLWYADRDVSFLQEDAKDAAGIEQIKASTIRQLIDGGFDPESVVEAVDQQDMTRLKHSGLTSVQLLPPGDGEGGEGDGAPDGTDDTPKPSSADEDRVIAKQITEMVQKVYLGIGKVVTASEARQILNRAGADLPNEFAPDQATPDEGENDDE